jgi:hypothetical protein
VVGEISFNAACGGRVGEASLKITCGGRVGEASLKTACGGRVGEASLKTAAGCVVGMASGMARAEVATAQPAIKAIRLSFMLIAPNVLMNAAKQAAENRMLA